MNAAELLERLGRPRMSGSEGLAVVVTGSPVEVALTRHSTDAAMHRTWRDRQQGRAAPLLVVRDAIGKPGLIRVLGPDERAAVREVPADYLAELLTGLTGASGLTASRQLAEELARLDEQGTPGLIVKGLLTRHIVTTRLRESDDWRWMTNATTDIAHEADWRSALMALGYRLERRPRRGWLARTGNTPALVVHPTADPGEFTRLDRDGRPPEGLLAVDCAAENVPYGVLASGGRLRLFRFTAEPGASATTTTFIELDTATLRQRDRPLLGLLAPSSLRSDGHFTRLVVEARRFGSALRDRLDVELRLRVLPQLARGLGAWALSEGQDLTDAVSREELERACMTWVFRALFVLYAESAGYLPLDHAGYVANAATTLATEAVEAGDILDARSTSLWDRFRVLVRALRTGDIAMRVPAYNGDLFSADAAGDPHACLRPDRDVDGSPATHNRPLGGDSPNRDSFTIEFLFSM